MKANSWTQIILLIGLGLICGSLCGITLAVISQKFGGSWEQITQSLGGAAPTVGEPAPNFELIDLAGEPRQLSNLSGGKPVLLNFWATWCKPCTLEMPIFQHYSEAYPDLQIIAVNIGEPEPEVRAYVEKWDLTFPVLLDPQDKVSRIYHASALPASYFVDNKGYIKSIHIGSMTEGNLKNYLKEIGILK